MVQRLRYRPDPRLVVRAVVALAAAASCWTVSGGGSGGTTTPSSGTAGALVLSQEIVELAHAAAALSRLALVDDPAGAAAEAAASGEESAPSSSIVWKRFQVFASEPDLAIVAKASGYCFASFRGTVNSGSRAVEDWGENLNVSEQRHCWTSEMEEEEGEADVASSEPSYSSACCSVRRGFYLAYRNGFRRDLEDAVRACAADCTNVNECVVLAGHSQGGAIAAVAALHLADLNPYVVTFGQPPAIDAPCPAVTSGRWFRFVNSIGGAGTAVGSDSGTGSTGSGGIFGSDQGISYDVVPFLPDLGTAAHFGHLLVLGDDPSAVAYGGLDAQAALSPRSVAAHGISSDLGNDDAPGYLDRIAAIRAHYATRAPYPVKVSGYGEGSRCTADWECESGACERDGSSSLPKRCAAGGTGATTCTSDGECFGGSGRCADGGTCVPKLGSCQMCDADSDCQSGTCGWNRRCAGTDAGGLMDDWCSCATGSDCRSGRCEGIVPRVCQPRLASGALCTEDNDCSSGTCSWLFRCVGDGAGDSSASVAAATAGADGAASGRSVLTTSMRGQDRSLKHGKARAVRIDDDADSQHENGGGDDDDDDDDGLDSPNPFRRKTIVEWCVFGVLAAAVSTFVSLYCCSAAAAGRPRRGRVGYDEIPTELTV
jgi:pimeloyl-ACP methyl ester carboxylesterase